MRALLSDVTFHQGAFWTLTGLWPMLHLRSFEFVTGPKRDDWLVKTIGGLISVVGTTLLAAAWRKRVTPEIALLGVGSATALGAADVIFTAQGKIRPVYLADAVVQSGFLAAWALQKPWRSRREARKARTEHESADKRALPLLGTLHLPPIHGHERNL